VSTSTTRLASVDEHLSTVLELVGNTPVERIPVADCLGLAIAEDLRSPIALPPFDNSAMDGYAVRARDIRDAPVELPVTDDIPAGRTELSELAPGTAQRIMTGAPVPPGAEEAGWKDTLKILPFEVTTVAIRWAPTTTAVNQVSAGVNKYAFDPTSGGPGYVWHCHILDHEDNEMMRSYLVGK